MKRSSDPDFMGLANRRLVSTLMKNLANMEHFSRRDTVSLSINCRFLEKHPFNFKGLLFVECDLRSAQADGVFAPQLEKLVLVVEQQQASGHRARVSFLVLTQTLLLSLGDLSGTQHLLTAQRVYMLLEPSLLEVIRDASAQVRRDNRVHPENICFTAACGSVGHEPTR